MKNQKDDAFIENSSKKKHSKEQKREKEIERLLAQLAASDLKQIRPRVAFILNHFEETRDSDVALMYKYWEVFYPELVAQDGGVNKKTMYRIEKPSSITRARAKIQNEYKLFLGSQEVQVRRRSLDAEHREAQIADKPSVLKVLFWADESGKNDKYLLVGGLCATDAVESARMAISLQKWKQEQNINYEFHFVEATKIKLEQYKHFLS